ncbi:MAG: terminase small subunit [Alphaproteobacteria bacterium]|nr:terminase small subunit [Alphaproteobacteria bacterium]
MSKAEEALKPLTGKQRAFVKAYCTEANRNATEAARLAGYRGNDPTLRAVASENLTKANVAEAIEAYLEELTTPSRITFKGIEERLAKIADDKDTPASAKVAAINSIKAMHGFDAPTKTESGKPGEFDRMSNVERIQAIIKRATGLTITKEQAEAMVDASEEEHGKEKDQPETAQ